jgi:hypothetical protein
MDSGVAALIGGVTGGSLALAGGWLERRWSDKRRWQLDRKTAYVQLLNQPLVLIWDANMMIERIRRPRDRHLPTLPEIEDRMRTLLAGIGESFSSVCAVGSPDAIRTGNGILEACLRLMTHVTTGHEPEALEATLQDLTKARLAFLDQVRADLGVKGAAGLPIVED